MAAYAWRYRRFWLRRTSSKSLRERIRPVDAALATLETPAVPVEPDVAVRNINRWPVPPRLSPCGIS